MTALSHTVTKWNGSLSWHLDRPWVYDKMRMRKDPWASLDKGGCMSISAETEELPVDMLQKLRMMQSMNWSYKNTQIEIFETLTISEAKIPIGPA